MLCYKWKTLLIRGILILLLYSVLVFNLTLYDIYSKEEGRVISLSSPNRSASGDLVHTLSGGYVGAFPSQEIPLVTVICNENKTQFVRQMQEEIYYVNQRQIEQFRVMLGTLLYFSNSPKWRIIVITDSPETFSKIKKVYRKWPREQINRISIERYSTYAPQTKNYSSFLNQYRPCAWQKIFLEETLPNEEAVVFMDSDILFTGPAEELWKEFSKFKSSAFIGLGPEPWYLKYNERPYAGRVGLNTGVMLLNFTKQRKLFKNRTFSDLIAAEISKAVKTPRHDQDVVNQFLVTRSHLIHEFDARWNFIPSDCSPYAPSCPDCATEGISIVHGADAVFFREVDEKYLALYQGMEKLTRRLDIPPDILYDLLTARGEGAYLLDLWTVCKEYDMFFPLLLRHLKKMIKTKNNTK